MTNPDLKFSEMIIILTAIKERKITQEVINLAVSVPEYLWNKYPILWALAGGNLNLSYDLAEFLEPYAKESFPEFFEENQDGS